MKNLLLSSAFLFLAVISSSWSTLPIAEAGEAINPKPVTVKAGAPEFTGDSIDSGGDPVESRFSLISSLIQLGNSPNQIFGTSGFDQILRFNSGFTNVRAFTPTIAASSTYDPPLFISNPRALIMDANDIYLVSRDNQILASTGGVADAIASSPSMNNLDLLAGNETAGFSPETGGASYGDVYFNNIESLAFINGGASILVADTDNGCLREVSRSAGTATAFVGSCTYTGLVDGSVSDARLSRPRSLTAFKTDGFFFSDMSRLRYVLSSTKQVKTVANLANMYSASNGESSLPVVIQDRGATDLSLYIIAGGNGYWELGNFTSDLSNSNTYLQWVGFTENLKCSPSEALTSPRIEGVFTFSCGPSVIEVDTTVTTGVYVTQAPMLYMNSSEFIYKTELIAGNGYPGTSDAGQLSRPNSFTQFTASPTFLVAIADTENDVIRLIPSASTGSSQYLAPLPALEMSGVLAMNPYVRYEEPLSILAIGNADPTSSDAALLVFNLINVIRIEDFPTSTGATSVPVNLTYVAGSTNQTGMENNFAGVNATFNYMVSVASPNPYDNSEDGFVIIVDRFNYCLRQLNFSRHGLYPVSTFAGKCGQMGRDDALNLADSTFNRPSSIVYASTLNGGTYYLADDSYIRRVTVSAGVSPVALIREAASASWIWSLGWDATTETLLISDSKFVARLSNFTHSTTKVLDGENDNPELTYINHQVDLLPRRVSVSPLSGVAIASKDATNGNLILYLAQDSLRLIDLSTTVTPSTTSFPRVTTTPVNSTYGGMYTYTNVAGTDFSGAVQEGVLATTRTEFSTLKSGAFDPSGQLFVADVAAGKILQFNSALTRVDIGASDLPLGGLVLMYFNFGATDNGLYALISNQIFQVRSSGLVDFAGTALGGSEDLGTPVPKLSANFQLPEGLVSKVDGTMVIADTGNACLRLIQSNVVTESGLCGSEGQADGTPGRFVAPRSLTREASTDVFYVFDVDRIRGVNIPAGKTVKTVAIIATSSGAWNTILNWNPNDDGSLFLIGGGSVGELKNLTDATLPSWGENPYIDYTPIATGPSRGLSYANHARQLLMKSGSSPQEAFIIYPTKVGKINFNDITYTAPTLPENDTPSPKYVVTQSTAAPGPTPTAAPLGGLNRNGNGVDGQLDELGKTGDSTDSTNGNNNKESPAQKFFSDNPAVAILVVLLVALILVVLVALAIISVRKRSKRLEKEALSLHRVNSWMEEDDDSSENSSSSMGKEEKEVPLLKITEQDASTPAVAPPAFEPVATSGIPVLAPLAPLASSSHPRDGKMKSPSSLTTEEGPRKNPLGGGSLSSSASSSFRGKSTSNPLANAIDSGLVEIISPRAGGENK